MRIRSATPEDAAALAAIYNPYIRDTSITFEIDPVDVPSMAARIQDVLKTLPYLVAEGEHGILGFSYATHHRKRAAYAWSVETSIWVAPEAQRKGVGKALLDALCSDLKSRQYQMALAGIALPNPGSQGLHEAYGFEPIGVYKNVGYKRGAWHDVGWWQLELNPPRVPPPTQGLASSA